MATIAELIQMSSNAYDGTSSALQNTTRGGPLLTGLSIDWLVIDNSNNNNNKFWTQGYFGVAYRNKVTGEIVIANRGTQLGAGASTALRNLISDAALGISAATPVQTDAALFARQVISSQAGTNYTSVIETGHSLGGSEAQAATVDLVDNVGLPSSQVSAVLRRCMTPPATFGRLDRHTEIL